MTDCAFTELLIWRKLMVRQRDLTLRAVYNVATGWTLDRRGVAASIKKQDNLTIVIKGFFNCVDKWPTNYPTVGFRFVLCTQING